MIKKKTLWMLLGGCFVFALVVTTLAIIFGSEKEEEKLAIEPIAIINISMDPSVELIIDKDTKVVSTYAKNNAGKMLLVEENLKDKNLDQAVKTIIDALVKTGFLLEGDILPENNTIVLSVTAENSSTAEMIRGITKTAIDSACEEYHVFYHVKNNSGLTKAQVIKYIMDINTNISELAVNELSYSHLLFRIMQYQNEVSSIYSVKLEEMYKIAKNSYMHLYQKKEINKKIAAMADRYQDTKERYNNAVVNVENTLQEYLDIFFEKYLLETGSYQEGLKELRKIKHDVNKQRVKVALEVDPLKQLDLKQELDKLEKAYTEKDEYLKAIERLAYEVVYEKKVAYDDAVAVLEETQMQTSIDVKQIVTAKIAELDKTVEEVSNGYFVIFQGSFASSIEYYTSLQTTFKNELLSAISVEK